MGDGLAIDLKGVSKVYKGRVHALRGIDMQVRRGEVFGLLGPNGAGKSTLVKIIMTVIRPTTAAGLVLGHTVGDKQTLARVGYLPENHRFPRYLTGRQVVEFFGALQKVGRPVRRRRAAELLDRMGMAKDADRKVSGYSKGMMQRVGLAQALVNDPELVLLDEPTDGVDPLGRRDIRGIMEEMRRQGKTVFVNSHLLSELELICDRVAILSQGVVARQGTVAELGSAGGAFEIEVEVEQSPQSMGLVMQTLGLTWPAQPSAVAYSGGAAPPPVKPFGQMPNGVKLLLAGNVVQLATTETAAIQMAIDALRSRGIAIKRVELTRQSLEDVFIQTVAGAPRGN